MAKRIFEIKKIKMLRIVSCLLLIGFAGFLHAQTPAVSPASNDTLAVKAVINRFFEGMEKGDSALLKSTCTERPLLQTFITDRNGQLRVVETPFADFISAISKPAKQQYKEVISFGAILLEQQLASVWTPYTFYVDGKAHHHGTNSFQLVKMTDGWKIQYIIDTRRTTSDD